MCELSWTRTVVLALRKSIFERSNAISEVPSLASLTSPHTKTPCLSRLADVYQIAVRSVSPFRHAAQDELRSSSTFADGWLGADQRAFRIASQQNILVWLPWRIMSPFRSFCESVLCVAILQLLRIALFVFIIMCGWTISDTALCHYNCSFRKKAFSPFFCCCCAVRERWIQSGCLKEHWSARRIFKSLSRTAAEVGVLVVYNCV